jgi:hypothetical protein
LKKHISIFIIITLLCVFGLLSCSTILTGIYGIKKIKRVNKNTIVRYAKKYNVSSTNSYELDTSYFLFLTSLDTIKYKLQIKNHYQPLQALYYDNTGYLKSFQVNCYAGGFPNLKWDINGIMSAFPPKQQAPIDSIIPLETQLKYLNPISPSFKLSIDSYDYIVIVYWNRFMGRQSKRLIHIVQENCKLEKEKKVKIIYANNDNIFVEK